MASNPPPPYEKDDPMRWQSGAQGPVPEILPPESYVPPPPRIGFQPEPPRPRPKRGWAVAPGTYSLVAINCAVYLLMTLSGVNPISPSPNALFAWGGNEASYVLYHGDWWRIVTAMFVHGGILHLALNMWCLWNLGLLAEPLMGTFGVIAAYLLTGAAGNLLSTFKNIGWPLHQGGQTIYPVGVGASGAVFGIAGALIVLLKSQQLPVPLNELKKIRRSVIYFAVINLVIGFSINVGTGYMGSGIAVDNMAHLGGCASGLLLAAPMIPRIGSPRRKFDFKLRVAVGMLAGILVLFGFFLAHLAQ